MKTSGDIKYRRLRSGGYKLVEDWWVDTGVTDSAARIVTERARVLVELDTGGRMHIRSGYRWDGPSGPIKFFASLMPSGMRLKYLANIMIASLAHDAWHQLMRERKLPLSMRKTGDKMYRSLAKKSGAWWFRRNLDYWGLRIGGRSAAVPQTDDESIVYTAV